MLYFNTNVGATLETMSKDKLEDAAKKRVREETKPPAHSPAPGQNPDQSENLGGFRDLFEDMWGDFENPQDSKRDEYGEVDSPV